MRRRTEHLGRPAPGSGDSRATRATRAARIGCFSMRVRRNRILDMRPCIIPCAVARRGVSFGFAFVLEEESNPLASAPAQGRRRAARAQSLAILHKVGCSWSARPAGVLRSGSAGPTTRPRFEPKRSTPAGRQTGEPTVSHEGCSGLDSSSIFCRGLSRRLATGPAKPAHSPPRASRRADPDPDPRHGTPDPRHGTPDPRRAVPDPRRAAPDPRRAARDLEPRVTDGH
jgi:hypothetical protein